MILTKYYQDMALLIRIALGVVFVLSFVCSSRGERKTPMLGVDLFSLQID